MFSIDASAILEGVASSGNLSPYGWKTVFLVLLGLVMGFVRPFVYKGSRLTELLTVFWNITCANSLICERFLGYGNGSFFSRLLRAFLLFARTSNRSIKDRINWQLRAKFASNPKSGRSSSQKQPREVFVKASKESGTGFTKITVCTSSPANSQMLGKLFAKEAASYLCKPNDVLGQIGAQITYSSEDNQILVEALQVAGQSDKVSHAQDEGLVEQIVLLILSCLRTSSVTIDVFGMVIKAERGFVVSVQGGLVPSIYTAPTNSTNSCMIQKILVSSGMVEECDVVVSGLDKPGWYRGVITSAFDNQVVDSFEFELVEGQQKPLKYLTPCLAQGLFHLHFVEMVSMSYVGKSVPLVVMPGNVVQEIHSYSAMLAEYALATAEKDQQDSSKNATELAAKYAINFAWDTAVCLGWQCAVSGSCITSRLADLYMVAKDEGMFNTLDFIQNCVEPSANSSTV